MSEEYSFFMIVYDSALGETFNISAMWGIVVPGLLLSFDMQDCNIS